MVNTGTAGASRVICIDPLGQVYGDNKKLIDRTYGTCQTGEVLVVTQGAQSLDPASYNFTGPDGMTAAVNLICGAKITGSTYTATTAKDARINKINTSLAREQDYTYLVIMESNGTVRVER